MYIPIGTKNIFQVIENSGSISELYYVIIIFAIISLGAIPLTLLSNYYQARLWLNLFVEKHLFYRNTILRKNYKNILDVGTGKLLTRLESGTHSEVDIFARLLLIITDVIFRGIFVIIILTYYIPSLFFLIISAIVLLGISVYFLKKYIKPYNERERKVWEEDGRNKVKIIMEQLSVNLYGKKEFEIIKNEKFLREAAKNGIKVDMANETFYKLVEFLIKTLEIAVYIIIGGIILTTAEYSLAHMVMFIWYIWFLWEPLNDAINNINSINRMWEKYIKLQEFINTPNDIKDGKKIYKYKSGFIEFKSVDFGYSENKKVFSDLNLNLHAGKKNALIGHSGGGKSTIMKILLRLYDYESGSILIDGQDLKKLRIDSFYKHIGYLPQDPSIFDGTIRENLEYAFPSEEKYDDNVVWDALKRARIYDMIKGLEKGLETEVGEKGIKLSGGEKQRLAIARIFLKDPEIILLDEPTSALDSISESEITKTLNELMIGKTSIIIAHRLQTVLNSDNITIIENGEILDSGNHSELLKSSATYKKLVDLQNGRIIE